MAKPSKALAAISSMPMVPIFETSSLRPATSSGQGSATTLRPWPGFQADPWTALADWSGPHWLGRARVLRGGSFATRSRMKHPKYRGFAAPERDDRFVGFRSCAF